MARVRAAAPRLFPDGELDRETFVQAVDQLGWNTDYSILSFDGSYGETFRGVVNSILGPEQEEFNIDPGVFDDPVGFNVPRGADTHQREIEGRFTAPVGGTYTISGASDGPSFTVTLPTDDGAISWSAEEVAENDDTNLV